MVLIRSYQELLQGDGDDPPPEFRVQSPADSTPIEVPVAVYVSREFHELEKRRLWARSWQVACRKEYLAEPGDQFVYDIADKSYLLVRARDGRIRAFVNACLHRGRRLRDHSGHAPSIRCPFHAFTWDLEGGIRRIPNREEEFPACADADWKLPEIAVGQWGGFVFINPDPAAEPLEHYLGDLSQHFARWPLDSRRLTTHVIKKLRCNWKIAQEAFMEAYHVIATHPQSAWATGDGPLSQYDAFGHFSRAITPRAVASPHLPRAISEQAILDGLLLRLGRGDRIEVGPGQTARSIYAAHQKHDLARLIGEKAAARLSTAEVADLIYYTVFPNFHPWGAYYQSVYLFRPNGDAHDSCLMEFMLLTVADEAPVGPPPLIELDFDESWTQAVGPRGRIFDQDSLNMPEVHRGLLATQARTVRLARRQEVKLRHFHALYRDRLGAQAFDQALAEARTV